MAAAAAAAAVAVVMLLVLLATIALLRTMMHGPASRKGGGGVGGGGRMGNWKICTEAHANMLTGRHHQGSMAMSNKHPHHHLNILGHCWCALAPLGGSTYCATKVQRQTNMIKWAFYQKVFIATSEII